MHGCPVIMFKILVLQALLSPRTVPPSCRSSTALDRFPSFGTEGTAPAARTVWLLNEISVSTEVGLLTG